MSIDHRISRPNRAHRTHRSATRRMLCGLAAAAAVASAAIGMAGPAAAAPAPIPPHNMRPAPVLPHRLPDPIDGFAGKTYYSVAVLGGAIPGGGPLVVAFAPQRRVGLSAGCNQHAGSATMAGDQLRIGPMISTMMACPGPRGRADRWLTSFASVPLTWRALGPVLVLSNPQQTVILTQR